MRLMTKSLSVLALGLAWSMIAPATAEARAGCKQCVHQCPEFVTFFCLSYQCGAAGNCESIYPACEDTWAYRVTCPDPE
jgi:hypothetical protein